MKTYIILTETAFKGSLREMSPEDHAEFRGEIDDDYMEVDSEYAAAIKPNSAWAIAVKNLNFD